MCVIVCEHGDVQVKASEDMKMKVVCNHVCMWVHVNMCMCVCVCVFISTSKNY